VGHKEVAEEIAQETYLKLYRLCQPEDVVCPRALLFDAATKLAISYLRRKRAENEVAVTPVDASLMDEVPDDLAQPERRAAAEQALQWLTQIVEQLPSNLQKVFVMRYARQMGRQEIADRLNISVNAVEQRLTRALTHCRVRLAALGLDWPALD
jgi:RNA polymerase sigma factor (sigma-70 family)